MKVYWVRASEWTSDPCCVCATEELAKRECKRLANEYGLEEDEEWEFINYRETEFIEE